MKKLEFKIDINAPKEKVWKVLWDDKTYREWTSVFTEGSYAVSDWKEGSKVLFLSANKDGMFSVIDKLVPEEEMVFKHLGIVKDGKEMPADEETKKWIDMLESYLLKEKDGVTEIKVSHEMSEEFCEYLETTFPKALAIVKKLSEE